MTDKISAPEHKCPTDVPCGYCYKQLLEGERFHARNLEDGNKDLANMLEEILNGMEASGGWEGDDGLFDRGMALVRKTRGEK